MLELTAKTEAGARLVRIAETLAEDFGREAACHDREASFPYPAIDALKRARYFAAPVPTENGGLGVTCVHDIVDRDRRQHAPRRAPEHRPALAGRANGRRPPPGDGLRRHDD